MMISLSLLFPSCLEMHHQQNLIRSIVFRWWSFFFLMKQLYDRWWRKSKGSGILWLKFPNPKACSLGWWFFSSPWLHNFKESMEEWMPWNNDHQRYDGWGYNLLEAAVLYVPLFFHRLNLWAQDVDSAINERTIRLYESDIIVTKNKKSASQIRKIFHAIYTDSHFHFPFLSSLFLFCHLVHDHPNGFSFTFNCLIILHHTTAAAHQSGGSGGDPLMGNNLGRGDVTLCRSGEMRNQKEDRGQHERRWKSSPFLLLLHLSWRNHQKSECDPFERIPSSSLSNHLFVCSLISIRCQLFPSEDLPSLFFLLCAPSVVCVTRSRHSGEGMKAFLNQNPDVLRLRQRKKGGRNPHAAITRISWKSHDGNRSSESHEIIGCKKRTIFHKMLPSGCCLPSG